jgi:hypothetical protein
MNEQLKSYKTVEQIAKKHRMDVSDIQKQLDMGAPIEHEHTNNQKLAVEIALQHLDEIPDYYTRLKKMEASAKKEHKKFKDVTEEKGLWANINARRKKGLSPKKPGEKGYPKTLDIEEGLKQARKNVGASKCWKNKKVGTPPTKIKGGEEVPNCVPVSESTDSLKYDWHTPVRERADRYCPKCEKLETRNECKYGPRYWDMFSLPAELISSKKDYNTTMPHPANEEKDYEYSMARSELSTIMNAARRLKKKMKGEGNIEAWVQSKITKAADYIDTAADYIDSGESKVNEDTTIEDANGNTFLQIIDIIKADRLVKEGISFDVGKPSRGAGALTPSAAAQLGPKAIDLQKKKAAAVSLPSTVGVKLADSYKLKSFDEFMSEASPAWQRKEGKNSEGGLNKKGIASYRKENPGSNLSLAVTTKPSELKKGSKSANRRKSFCSRMSGMKKKLTSAKTANDPDSRINKSLRKWNC